MKAHEQEQPKCVRCKKLHREWLEYQLMLKDFKIKPKRRIPEPEICDATHGLNMWTVSADGMERTVTEPTQYIVCAGCAIQVAEEDRHDEVYRGKVKKAHQHIALYLLEIKDGKVTAAIHQSGMVWDKNKHEYVKPPTKNGEDSAFNPVPQQ